MIAKDYHIPVLLQESIDALNIIPDGIYVDATFGAGGHSKPILNSLSAKGHLYGFDQDKDARRNQLQDEKFTFIPANFKYLKRFLRLYEVTGVNGILADLGVSSFQLDEASRGFAYRFDSTLDMRMNQQSKLTAADILNSYSYEQLLNILSTYGEVRNSKQLARSIVERRRSGDFGDTAQFVKFLEQYVMGNYPKYMAQVFQALRIEVNDEMNALIEFLNNVIQVLLPGGRLAVITYHSVEDRIVKNFMKYGNAEGVMSRDAFGKIWRPFDLVNKKIIVPNSEEQSVNPRSRSAKLRIAELL